MPKEDKDDGKVTGKEKEARKSKKYSNGSKSPRPEDQPPYRHEIFTDDMHLASDVHEEEAFAMMQDLMTSVPEVAVVFSDFTETDLREFVRVFSFVNVKEKEVLMYKDEPATFCFLLMSGKAEAKLSERALTVTRGRWLGEMAFFDKSGTRSADVIASQDSLIAITTYADINKLGELRPQLQTKVVKMLAEVSIRALRVRVVEITEPALAPALESEPIETTGSSKPKVPGDTAELPKKPRKPAGETFVKKRLAKNPVVRAAVIYKDSARFKNIAETKTDEDDNSNHLLGRADSQLTKLNFDGLKAIFDTYHKNKAFGLLYPKEIRTLARDLVELCLSREVNRLYAGLEASAKDNLEFDRMESLLAEQKHLVLPGYTNDNECIAAMVHFLGEGLDPETAADKPQRIDMGKFETHWNQCIEELLALREMLLKPQATESSEGASKSCTIL